MRNESNSEPINYEQALRDLTTRRRRRGFTSLLRRLDPRPTSSSQVMLVGLALAIVGWLIPVVHVAMIAGVALLAAGFLTGLMQPRSRRVVWRGRPIDLPPDETWATRLYRTLYRSS
jgi:hypothetical protein